MSSTQRLQVLLLGLAVEAGGGRADRDVDHADAEQQQVRERATYSTTNQSIGSAGGPYALQEEGKEEEVTGAVAAGKLAPDKPDDQGPRGLGLG